MALEILRPAFVRLDWVALSNASLENPRYWLTGLSAAWLGAIVGLSLWRARFWCRILCPLGALLGALGRWAPVGRRVTDACIDCGACARTCPMEAVGEDPRGTLQEACIRCRRCADACPTAAIRFLPAPGGGLPARMASPVLSRRGALAAGVAGLLVGITSPLDAGRAAPRDRLIRPPGALPEEEFLDQCLRCGLCMGACMSHTLQPTLWEAGLDGVWTPRLDLRLAPCEKNCNRCGLVCPTGAIRPLELMERTHAKIGTAVLLRERCLVWEQDKVCLVCDEICPYDAIEFRDVDGRRRPFVTESRCNGCGYCEHKCPVQGESAIIVSRAGELRLASGSYVEAARERGYAFEGPRPDEAPAPAPGADGGLPTGLIRKDP
jgi:MauM/NapG family ferredoxin protein